MAGRGRRYGGYGEKSGPLRRPGEAPTPPATTGNIKITALIRKIKDIDILSIDPILLDETEKLFKQLFVTGKAVEDVLSSLHAEALEDSDFGEKLVIALEQVCTFEVDDVCVRSKWLTLLQEDHGSREAIRRSSSRKFANAVMLIGAVLNVIKINGKPIQVLVIALLDYLDLLIDSEDEVQFQVLATQVILNGNQIVKTENATERFELLSNSLRTKITTGNVSSKGRCWILLAIDYILNNLKPLNGVARKFYIEKLGNDYKYFEARSKGTTPGEINTISPKFQVSPSSKSETQSVRSNKSQLVFPLDDVTQLDNFISNVGQRGMRSVTKSNKQEGVVNFGSKKGDDAKSRRKNQGTDIKVNVSSSKPPTSDDDFYGLQIEKTVCDKKGQN